MRRISFIQSSSGSSVQNKQEVWGTEAASTVRATDQRKLILAVITQEG